VPKKTVYACNTAIAAADLKVYKRDQWGVLSELTGGCTVSPGTGLTPAGTKTITVTATGVTQAAYSVLVNPNNAPELYVVPKKTFYQQYDLTFRLANDAQLFRKESTGVITHIRILKWKPKKGPRINTDFHGLVNWLLKIRVNQ
jgi:hypothetical protein